MESMVHLCPNQERFRDLNPGRMGQVRWNSEDGWYLTSWVLLHFHPMKIGFCPFCGADLALLEGEVLNSEPRLDHIVMGMTDEELDENQALAEAEASDGSSGFSATAGTGNCPPGKTG